MNPTTLVIVGVSIFLALSEKARAGEFDDADRHTADEYGAIHGETAETVEARYAATGDFRCGSKMGQANLVMRNDVIILTSHEIYEPRTCAPLADLKTCYFTIESHGKKQKIFAQEIINSGYKCPNNAAKRGEMDWAVLRLKTTVDKRIKPYQVNGTGTVNRGNAVAVGKSHDFSAKDSNGNEIFPRHYGDCEIKDAWSEGGITNLLGTNCDSSGYSSGGGLFTPYSREEPPTLVGIMQRSNESDDLADQALAENRINKGTYDPTTWDSAYVPIAGELQQTLLKFGSPK